MIATLARTGRLLAAHWPALAAWYLFGVLGNAVFIRIAGFVGAYTSVGGFAILSLAVLTPLIGFVAMFLVLRDGMAHLQDLAPLPADPAVRRRQFTDAVLGGILPFFAVYAAWGYLRDDVSAYLMRALQQQDAERWRAVADGGQFVGEIPGDIGFTPAAVAVLVIAFVGRWALKRYRSKLPRWTSAIAVYLEAVWVLIAVQLVTQALGALNAWVQSRQAMVWLADLRQAITDGFAPLAFAWEGVEWLVGEAGGIILRPIAWLTIAGVLYGQAVVAQAPALGGARVTRVRTRYGRLPQRFRRRLTELWGEVVGRFRPIWNALVLMWRAGPLLIAGYVLLYAVLMAAEGWGRVALTRAIGPHDLSSFWLVADTTILLLVPFVIEPIRVALVASAYDDTVGKLTASAAPAVSLGKVDGEPDEAGVAVDEVDVEEERAGDVVGEQEQGGDQLPIHPV